LDPRHPKGNGPASVSVREGRPAAIGDVFVDERFAPFRAHALSAGYLAVASVPLCAQGHVRGCLTLYYARRREFRQSELDLVSAVADGVALALERMDLSERLVANAVANRSFEEADRLKGEFISTVSHELRTPLTIIKGYTDLLVTEQAGSLNETQQKFLLGVQRNTVRLTDLVSDLLDVSRLDGGQLEMERRPLDVGRIVAESVAEYERVAAERGGSRCPTRAAPTRGRRCPRSPGTPAGSRRS
jgi:K+-sensing histidine kinase KdpD